MFEPRTAHRRKALLTPGLRLRGRKRPGRAWEQNGNTWRYGACPVAETSNACPYTRFVATTTNDLTDGARDVAVDKLLSAGFGA